MSLGISKLESNRLWIGGALCKSSGFWTRCALCKFDGLQGKGALCKFDGLWIVGASRSSSGLKIDSGIRAPFRGDFDPLKELYDLGNMLESLTRQSNMVKLAFLDELKY